MTESCFTRRDGKRVLLAILLVALAIRLGSVLWLGSQIYWYDERFYDNVAAHAADGEGFIQYGRPTSFRSPFYMMFVAGVYAAFGRSILAVRIVQAFVGTATCFLVYLLGRRLFSRTEGLVAAGLAAVYPLLVYTNSVLYPETLSSVLLLGMLLLLLELDRRPRALAAITLGLLVAITALCAPPTLLFAACALCWLVTNRANGLSRRLISAGVCGLVALCAVAPWTYRNYLAHGHFVPITTNSGYNLWYGNHPSQGASIKHNHEPDFPFEPNMKGSFEWQRDVYLRDEAVRLMRSNPMRTARMMVLKGLNLWRLWPDTSTSNKFAGTLANAVIALTYGPVLCLAVFSLFRCMNLTRENVLCALVFASLTCVYAVFLSKVRYRVPIDCVLIALASRSLLDLIRGWVRGVHSENPGFEAGRMAGQHGKQSAGQYQPALLPNCANAGSERSSSDDGMGGAPNEKPRVAIVAANASPRFGGEPLLPVNYFRILREMGVEAWLVCHARSQADLISYLPDEMERMFFIPDTWIHKLVWRMGRPFPEKVREWTFRAINILITEIMQRRLLTKLVEELEVQVVHCPMPVSPKMPSAIRAVGAPVVVGPMNGGMEYAQGFRYQEGALEKYVKILGRMVANLMNLVIPGKREAALLLVSNQRTYDALPRVVRHVPVGTLVEYGVDTSLFRPADHRCRVRQAQTCFIFVGSLIELKGVDLLLTAFSALPEQWSMRLEIVGDGPMRQHLEQMTRCMRIDDRVTFRGWLAQRDVAELLTGVDVFVLPSVREAGGAVVLEAMAAGLPVIIANWGGPADYVDESCGILVDADSRDSFVEGLKEAMLRLAVSPELQEQMGRNGRRKVEKYFDWHRKVELMLKIYREVASRHGNSRFRHARKESR